MAAAWTSAFGIVDRGADSLQGVRSSDRAEHAQQGALLGGLRLGQASFHLPDTGGRIRCLQADGAQGLLGRLQVLGTACLGEQVEQGRQFGRPGQFTQLLHGGDAQLRVRAPGGVEQSGNG